MKVLLDTHAFLWWILDDPALPATAREIIADPSNTVFLSVASAWEIAIKAQLGRLSLAPGEEDLDRFVTRQVEVNRFQVLPVQLNHALRVCALPLHHPDPFDRLLVAQAEVEALPILTRDPHIRRYGVQTLW